ncbi:hypothetical protein CEK60_06095 [Halomonas sp. N3-2A]|nr:hypothetical protein CEK60_06095 [Halomonas sp. N3-2A]
MSSLVMLRGYLVQNFNIISKSECLTYKVELDDEGELLKPCLLFLSLFGVNEEAEIFIDHFIELKKNEKFSLMLRRYLANCDVDFSNKKKIRSFFGNIMDGEVFYFKSGELAYSDRNFYSNELTAINLGFVSFNDFESYMKEREKNLGIEGFRYFFYGQNVEKRIGAKEKYKRICRFCKCGPNKPEKFKLKAHAISEALGNKKIILNEECDDCNRFFGDKLEQDIVAMIGPMRMVVGDGGKKRSPKFKAGKYELKKEDDVVNVKVDAPYNPENNDIIFPESGELVYQNVYKALVKYAMSVIPDTHLEYFNITLKWLLKSPVKEKLPPVYNAVMPPAYNAFKGVEASPRITVFFKKDDNVTAFCEFIACDIVWVFWLPTFTDMDSFDFDVVGYSSKRHGISANNYMSNDYSQIDSKKIQHSITFNQK